MNARAISKLSRTGGTWPQWFNYSTAAGQLLCLFLLTFFAAAGAKADLGAGSGASASASANSSAFHVDPSVKQIDLAKASWLLEDPEGKLTLADVQQAGNAGRFKHQLPDIGYTASAFWLRFTLVSDSSEPITLWLDSGNRTLQEIALFSPDEKGVYQSQSASTTLPFAQRPLPTADFVFPVSFTPQKETTIYLRVRSTGYLGVIVVPQLWQPAALQKKEERDKAQWLFYLGLCTSLVLFHLMLGISVKDANYIRYMLPALGSMWAMSSSTGGFGTAYASFWPNSPVFEQSGWVASIMLVSFGPVYFLLKFLDFHKTIPRMDTVLKIGLSVIALLVSIQLIGTLVAYDAVWLLQKMYISTMAIFILTFAVAICSIFWLAWHGNRQARFLCITWFPVLSFGTTWSLYSMLGYKFDIALVMWASAVEQILMSLVLADRFNQEKKATGEAQVTMAQVLRESELELEGKVANRTQALEKEQARTRQLLNNILPVEIATELSETGSAKPARHEAVSILFTDFMGFRQAVSDMQADQMVTELNEIFAAFDDITDACGVEKIKSIGDAYMAAAGLPKPCADHAQRCVRAGLRMVAYIEQRNEKADFKWFLRVGIHSGPVVAGVVGKRKFAFDIWGDTVNVAARIESAGDVGRVNISAYTYDLIQSEFMCQYRGKLNAKGKGAIDMYFVSEISPS
jgi:class 3 adenylate cyclase